MIRDAEKAGLITPGVSTIIEPTSGNTGIGLAAICAIKGYRLILIMPANFSIERRKILKAYGAELVLIETGGMNASIQKANELKNQIPNSVIPNQFSNPSVPLIHEETTAQEIWKDTNGNIDIFIAGVGTGGTISGVGKILKQKNNNIKIIAVEPDNNRFLSEKKFSPHKIQGIGPNFVPDNFKYEFVDEIFQVTENNAIETAKSLARNDGIFCGISSGANVYSSLQIAKRVENKGKNIVTIICDRGDRYLSTDIFEG
jgi:cysteine synthase A